MEVSGQDVGVIKYADALQRLNQIVEEIENSAIDVDELEAAVKEAVGLISLCRARLSGAQLAVEQALTGLKPEAT